MAKTFTIQDFVALLQVFPPTSPLDHEPTLLSNRSGDRLYQSIVLQRRFDELIDKTDRRLPLSSIRDHLGLDNINWLLQVEPVPLLYDAEGKAIVGSQETRRLLAQLKDRAEQDFTYLHAFAAEHDIDTVSMKAILKHQPDLHIIQDLSGKTARTWVFSHSLDHSTREQIEVLLRNAGADHKVDLSSKLPSVPRFLIQQLSEDISQVKNIPGTVRLGKTRITFSSEAYRTRVEEERARRVAQQFSKILVYMHKHGYHPVPDDDEDAPGLQRVFYEKTKDGVDDGSFILITSKERPIALAFTNRLEDVLTDLKRCADDLLVESWKVKGAAQVALGLDQDRKEKLGASSLNSDFAKLILQDSRYCQAIEQSMLAKLEELESEYLQGASTAFNDYVRSPIRLYLVGINHVEDQSLRQRLEDFILEFLRKDLIPNGVQLSMDEKQRDRPFGKELVRFSQACTDAKTLADIQTALSKFARKQKLPSISLSDERDVRRSILQQKVKSLKKMVRASDILQNLIWLLLAQELDGIFISSGRDTTRMIKFYQSVGDAEKARWLNVWKDKFKEGQESREDIEGMRTMAENVISQMSIGMNGMHTPEKQQ